MQTRTLRVRKSCCCTPFGTSSPCPWRSRLTGIEHSNVGKYANDCPYRVYSHSEGSCLCPHAICSAYWGRKLWSSQERKDWQVSSILSFSSWSVLAIQDDQAVIWIHGHSVKGFEWVIQICKHYVKDFDVKDTKRDLVSPESAMFFAHLSHFDMLYNCYQEGKFCWQY